MTEQFSADVVIVGSGVAGSLAAYSLVAAGVDTLILEAGQKINRDSAVRHFQDAPDKGQNSPYPPNDYAPWPVSDNANDWYVDVGPDKWAGLYIRGIGGTTWHWTGFATRLRESDMSMQSSFGVGVDWPITYDDLVPWYEIAEKEWGVAGFDGQDWGAPRTEPYPLPGIPATYMDKQVAKAAEGMGLTVGQFSQARNSIVHDGRPACCGNNTCDPICPIQAKYDATVHIKKATNAGAKLEAGAVAYDVVVGDDGSVTKIKFKRPDGSEGEATGKYYLIGCHAIETPRLLLMSKRETTPNGVANGSDTVGRYLMSQLDVDTMGYTPDPVYPYRGPQQTSGIVEFRDGDFRKEYAAVGMSLMNDGWHPALGPGITATRLAKQGTTWRGTCRDKTNWYTERELRLNSSAESLPSADNRVELADDKLDPLGLPKPKVSYTVDEWTKKGLQVAIGHQEQILKTMNATDISTDTPSLSAAIIIGTTRMGTDEKTSVVDANMKTHQHDNLYIVGTSTHCSAPVNPPTLTVAALALRTADEIKKRLTSG